MHSAITIVRATTTPRGRSLRWPRATTALAALLTSIVYSLPLAFGTLLVRPLESRFERVDRKTIKNASGMIVLGGAGDTRIRAAGELARRYPHLLIVLTGTGYSRDELEEILGSGIEPNRVVVEEQARNTRENALYVGRLLAGRENERWLLVTSATHMPRAMGAFWRLHLEVRPWPLADTPDDWETRNRVAFHEWGGLMAYRLRGYSSELLPSPAASHDEDSRAIRTSAVAQD